MNLTELAAVAAVLVPIVVLLSFAGCGFDGVATGTADAPPKPPDAPTPPPATPPPAGPPAGPPATTPVNYHDLVLKGPTEVIAYWKLGDTVVGGAAADGGPDPKNPGIYRGGVALANGVLRLGPDATDQATAFDGATGFVNVPYNTVMNPVSNTNFSVEACDRTGHAGAGTVGHRRLVSRERSGHHRPRLRRRVPRRPDPQGAGTHGTRRARRDHPAVRRDRVESHRAARTRAPPSGFGSTPTACPRRRPSTTPRRTRRTGRRFPRTSRRRCGLGPVTRNPSRRRHQRPCSFSVRSIRSCCTAASSRRPSSNSTSRPRRRRDYRARIRTKVPVTASATATATLIHGASRVLSRSRSCSRTNLPAP